MIPPGSVIHDALSLVCADDFSKGAHRWETTDPAARKLGTDGARVTWGLTQRKSVSEPRVRSPHNVALVKDLDTPLIEADDRTFTAGRVGIGSCDDMNEFTAVTIQGSKAGVTPSAATGIPTCGRAPTGPASASWPTSRP